MTQDSSPITLADAAREYISSLKPDQQHAQETYIRRCVEHFGDHTTIASLSGSRVELFAESQIRASDPNAQERVNALKQYFQFIRKKGYATENFGIHIRVRRSGGRSSGAQQVRVEEAPVEMTKEGLEARCAKLADLQSRRPDVLRAIATAREDKDFRENAPLQAAREELAMIDGQIKQLEAELKRAVVVERTSEDLSAMGSQVKVTRLDRPDQMETFTLVGGREANAKERKISVESPVGKKLLGRRVGEEVEVAVPSGSIQYRIEAIIHP